MHLLASETVGLDDGESAVDLGLTPAEVLVFAHSDSDLAAIAAAHRRRAAPFSLRAIQVQRLRHPYSVDLVAERLAPAAKLIVVRLLGGRESWRYGLDELARLARRPGGPLLVALSGEPADDPRLEEMSRAVPGLRADLDALLRAGGPDNLDSAVGRIATVLGRPMSYAPPQEQAALAPYAPACRPRPEAPRALIVAYRALVLADDCAPLEALAEALAGEGFSVETLAVTSLKDPAVVAELVARLTAAPPAVIVNTTAFSARLADGGTVLDRAGVPVLQAPLALASRDAWAASMRGLGAADLAMNIVLPEVDGRIPAPPLSFKGDSERVAALEFTRTVHVPEPDGVAHVAALVAAWTRLARLPNADKRLALVIPDYPGRAGRGGRAVGLDTAASAEAVAGWLREAGYVVADLPEPLVPALETAATCRLAEADYVRLFAALPEPFRAAVVAAWGAPAGEHVFSAIRAGNLIVALQPDRGRPDEHEAAYHDPNRPPCHRYVAFHLWLRHVVRLDALIQLGTHGTLEWLPGKAVALSAACAPRVLTGAVPVVYPFIVNNPGEAAHARRRLSAVTLGHLTPPLVEAGLHGVGAEVETLMDEYAAARGLDPRRARRAAAAILARAAETGLDAEVGIAGLAEPEALARLDAWLCDLKERRIGDGLHILGAGADAASAASERANLLAALAGRFVPPGPSGAPGPTRRDVLPTGRNLYAVDPRAIPTPTAYAMGRELAREVAARHAQDHGDWPRSLVIDLWGASTMRTGGEDLGQALALIGAKPIWDAMTGRVTGVEILPPAVLDQPRVDVTLRVSGLFRDVFPLQIALFDQAVEKLAARDEPAEVNPLAAAARAEGGRPYRIFGAAPGAYGVRLAERLDADPMAERATLAAAYLAAGGHAYGRDADGEAAGPAFAARIAAADALVHVEDLEGRDVLDDVAFAEHEGGFAAAAAELGAAPALYHVDSAGGRVKVATLAEATAKAVRARLANPRWLAGQMRHGHRGAAEIADGLDNLFAVAVAAEATTSRQFDLVFDATLGDDRVRAFLMAENPAAAAAMARAFDAAARRGLWTIRRNAPAAILAELLAEAPP
jgi:cobaltochelatase CobN